MNRGTHRQPLCSFAPWLFKQGNKCQKTHNKAQICWLICTGLFYCWLFGSLAESPPKKELLEMPRKIFMLKCVCAYGSHCFMKNYTCFFFWKRTDSLNKYRGTCQQGFKSLGSSLETWSRITQYGWQVEIDFTESMHEVWQVSPPWSQALSYLRFSIHVCLFTTNGCLETSFLSLVPHMCFYNSFHVILDRII